MRAKHNGRAGFTPHLYTFHKQVGDKIYYSTLCCMNGCGTYYYEDNGKHYLAPIEDEWSGWKTMKLSDWNSLVLFKDTGFEI